VRPHIRRDSRAFVAYLQSTMPSAAGSTVTVTLEPALRYVIAGQTHPEVLPRTARPTATSWPKRAVPAAEVNEPDVTSAESVSRR
jgi:hypothetical protein